MKHWLLTISLICFGAIASADTVTMSVSLPATLPVLATSGSSFSVGTSSFVVAGGSATVAYGLTASSLNVGLSTFTASSYFGVIIATVAAGAAGAAVNVSCPSGKFALYGGCSCTGTATGTNTNITNAPLPTPTAGGSMPTGWQCQSADSTTGQTCAGFVVCSFIKN